MDTAKIESEILSQIQDLAANQFHRMEKTQNYGGFSRNRVLQALPLSARSGTLLPSPSFPEELEKQELEAKLKVGRKKISLDEPDEVNAILKKAGSQKFLLAGHVGDYRCIVFGNGTTEKRGRFKLTVLHTEDIRTPIAILPMAAVVSKGHITLREVAMDIIISEKWEQMARYPESEYGPTLPQKVRNGLKKKTLQPYGILPLSAFQAKRALMREELLETTMDHELAHAVILGGELSKEEAAFSEAFSGEESNVLTLYNEFLAEFMPKRAEFMGPLARMCLWAKEGNIQKATRLYYRYLSDSFFYGNPDEEGLTGLTDSVVTQMSTYMNEDGTIDFGKLEGDLEHVYSQILGRLRKLTETILHTIQKSPDYSKLKKEKGRDRTEFWWKIQKKIDKEHPELKEKLKKIFENGKDELFKKIGTLRQKENSQEALIPLLAKVLSIPKS